MNDEALGPAWTTLEPTGPQRRRIDAQVFAWLDAHDTTLAAEWLGLFRSAPLTAFGLATASAVSLAAAPPLIWLRVWL
jgi:hypothetical protein